MKMNGAIATPYRVKLSDGEEYTFSKIGICTLAEFEEWVNVQNGRKPGCLMEIDEVLKHVMTFSGMRWMFWRSLQTHHPEIKIGDVGNLISDMDQMTSIIETIMDFPDKEEGDDENPPQKKESP